MERQLSGTQKAAQKEMKRIEKKGERQVCFTKRRNGLFKKASELSILCGVEVAIIVYSPAGKPYTFGCPAVAPVINKFLSDNSDQPDQFSSANNSQFPHQGAIISHLKQQYADNLSRLDTETLRRLMMQHDLNQAAKASPKCIWAENIEQLGINKLEQTKESLYQIKFKLMAEQNKSILAGASSTPQLVNYFDPLSDMMTANVPFPKVAKPTGNVLSFPPNHMVCQHDPRMIGFGQISLKPSTRVKFDMNVAPDEWLSDKECPKTDEYIPYSVSNLGSIGGTANSDGIMTYSLNSGMNNSLIPTSYRTEMYPINPVVANHDPFIRNSFSLGYKGIDVEADKNYNFKPCLSLKPHGSTAQDQPIPNIGGTSNLKFGYIDLNVLGQIDARPSGSVANISVESNEDVPERSEANVTQLALS